MSFSDVKVSVMLVVANGLAVWLVQAEAERQAKEARIQESLRIADEVKARKEAMRREAGLPVDSAR